ncbi:MAG: hypothetical protein LBI42_11435 [Chitinispirillales bacterium]|nr:hypothetical protein [Chitinispirillales bacterium]
MSVKSVIKRSVVAIGILSLGAFASGNKSNNTVTLSPSEPSHYLYSPMSRVTPANHLVLGLREISFGLPGNLHIQMSLVDNIGKTNLAAKYGLADNLAIGGGLASTFIDFTDHGIPSSDSRLGLFLTYAFVNSRDFSMAITPHTQIGSRFSIGADFGLMKTPNNTWSFLWEAGLSADTHKDDGALYLYTTGALRIHPASIPFLFIDAGVGTNEFKAVKDPYIRARAFIDIMVCFITVN